MVLTFSMTLPNVQCVVDKGHPNSRYLAFHGPALGMKRTTHWLTMTIKAMCGYSITRATSAVLTFVLRHAKVQYRVQI